MTSRSVVSAAAPISPDSSPSVTSTSTDHVRSPRAASTRAASSETATPKPSSAAPGASGAEVVMREQPDGLARLPRQDGDDVRHPRGLPELRPPRVRFLHADVVAEESQLIDD